MFNKPEQTNYTTQKYYKANIASLYKLYRTGTSLKELTKLSHIKSLGGYLRAMDKKVGIKRLKQLG